MDWTQFVLTLIGFIPDILALVGGFAVTAAVTPNAARIPAINRGLGLINALGANVLNAKNREGPTDLFRSLTSVSLVLVLATALIVAPIGCAKGKAPSPEQCAKLFTEAASLTMTIADIATNDEEVLDAISRATTVSNLAAELGCPIVIPLLESE